MGVRERPTAAIAVPWSLLCLLLFSLAAADQNQRDDSEAARAHLKNPSPLLSDSVKTRRLDNTPSGTHFIDQRAQVVDRNAKDNPPPDLELFNLMPEKNDSAAEREAHIDKHIDPRIAPDKMKRSASMPSRLIQNSRSLNAKRDQSLRAYRTKRNVDYELDDSGNIEFQFPDMNSRTDTEFRTAESKFQRSASHDQYSSEHESSIISNGRPTPSKQQTLSTNREPLYLHQEPLDSFEIYLDSQIDEEFPSSSTQIRLDPQLEGTPKNRPTQEDSLGELARRVETRLGHLAHSANASHPRLGLDSPLDPLVSSSTLRYVHEGDLLQLRLVLENVTLVGLSSLSVQEVDFRSPPPGRANSGGSDDVTWEDGEEGGGGGGRGGRKGRGARGDVKEGLVRVAFKDVKVKAKYQVRGSAGGFLTFKESGDMTLTSPTVFLTSRLALSIPPAPSDPQSQSAVQRRRHGGRIKVVRVRSDVSLARSSLLLRPSTSPPQWVRQQVQTKLEELSSDLSHGHGAVRLLLRRWGRALKRLVHRTARNMHF